MLDQYISSSGNFTFPSFTVAIFTILLAVFLSAILAITYRVTFQGETFPNNFFQAIVLSSTVTSMVMMAVGDNLAVGFGVLGAVSIIRFRTLMRNPRNIIFIFASLSVGIATGVFGYAVAISGTLIFCVVVFLLYFSSFGREADQKFELLFSLQDEESLGRFYQALGEQNVKGVINRIRHLESGDTRYTFLVGLKLSADRDAFFRSIVGLDGLKDVRLEHKDNDEQL